jgi:hypothetical protein
MINQFPSGCPFALLEEVKNYPRVLLLSGSLIHQQPLLDILASRRIASKMPGRSTGKKSVDDYRARGEDQLSARSIRDFRSPVYSVLLISIIL